jgi:mRNA-degrading endonuclease toxin of MazEF toxin-antitoxin module
MWVGTDPWRKGRATPQEPPSLRWPMNRGQTATSMSMKRVPRKPDRYRRGGVYLCDLPTQLITETTDGIVHHRDGVERHGLPPCIVISTAGFNDSQANGLIVVPIISGVNVDLAKFKKVPPTWVRVIAQGEPGFALIEQVRYIDQSRCKVRIGQLLDFDLKQVENKLKQLLFP